MRPKIHYYSDCPFFGGCENMISTFLRDAQFQEDFDITFDYRRNPRYQDGLSKRVGDITKYQPIGTFDHYDIYNAIDAWFPKVLRKPLKAVVNLFLIKYILLVINIFILYDRFLKLDIDILHINNGGYPGAYSTISAVFAAKMANVKNIVYVINNIPARYKSPERWLDYPIDQLVVSIVTRFVTGSEYAMNKAIDILGIPKEKIIFIHNGIIPRAVTETREEVLTRIAVSSDRFIITIIANLEKRKGHIYLLKAIQYIKDTHPEVPAFACIIEGDGPEEANLKAAAGNDQNIIFIGHENNIFNLINASDCIILPSIENEDLPNIIIEAMCLGKPTIASDIAGIPEEISHESGILVPPGDYKRLAEAIVTVMLNKDLRATIGKNAISRFKNEFTHDKALEGYRSLYRQIMETN